MRKTEKMLCSEQHCYEVFDMLLILWSQYFFTKRCAFRRSTRIYKVYLRHLKSNPLTRAKTVKMTCEKGQKSCRFARNHDINIFFSYRIEQIKYGVLQSSFRSINWYKLIIFLIKFLWSKTSKTKNMLNSQVLSYWYLGSKKVAK